MMIKNRFIALVVVVNVTAMLVHIAKQAYTIKWSFDNQRLEKKKCDLLAHKDLLVQELSMLKSSARVKKIAEHSLGMQKLALNQIRTWRP